MNRNIILGVCAGFLALSSFSANAQERWPRWYVGVSGSLSYLTDADLSGTAATDMEFDSGWGVSGAVGYLPATDMLSLNAFRFEAEVAYHTAGVDQVSFGPATVRGSGSLKSLAYMANMYYDIHTDSQWMPYFGGGLGWAEVELSNGSGAGNITADDSVFAYQLMAGIGYTPYSIPNTQWSIGYRYMGTQDPSFATGAATAFEMDYDTHNLEAGMKMRF